MPAPRGEKWETDIEREIALLKQATRRPFANTGLHCPAPGVLDSDTYVPATSGFHLDGATGKAEFKDITLYDLPNSMLANPVSGGFIYDNVSGFAVPGGSLGNIRTTLVPVPSGFTGAIVSVTARCYAINSTAGLDYLYCQANINGFNGVALPTPASGSGGSVVNVSPFAVRLDGLASGSSISIQIAVAAAFGAWAADAGNQADVSGSVIWFR